MIPILFEATEKAFESNGIGRLTDCTSCVVTEERNGAYECVFEYPATGPRYGDIQEGRVVLVDHDETGDAQPFVIYGRSAPISGLVTFYAHHISYQLSGVILQPFTAHNVAEAFVEFQNKAMNSSPFEYWTDNVTTGTMTIDTPISARSALGGVEGSILDIYGGEYEFDRFTIKNYGRRGVDTGVTIRYGKNLVDLTQDVDQMTLYNAIVPYWVGAEGACVYGGIVYGSAGIQQAGYWMSDAGIRIQDNNGADFEFAYSRDNIAAFDFTSRFEEQPTVQQLEAAAAAYLEANRPWLPKVSLKVDFVALWQTEDYKDFAPLERVRLCDTVTVVYTALGIEATAKVIKTEWNALAGKYNAIEIGDAKSSFAQVLQDATDKKMAQYPTITTVRGEIEDVTRRITGSTGGHVVLGMNADGQPERIYVLDSLNISEAVNCLVINKDGIGFSRNGVGGPFTTAWTIDGHFLANVIDTGELNAAMIRVGTMLADRIRGGTLLLGGTDNDYGLIQVLDGSGDIVTAINRNGITTSAIVANDYVRVDGSRNTASYIKMGLPNSGLMEMSSTNGFRIQRSTSDGSITKDVQLATQQITGTTGPLGADVIVADGSVSNHPTRAIIKTGSIQLSDLSGSGSGGLAPDGLPVAYARIGTNLFEVVSDYEAGSTRKYVRYQNGAFVVGGGATKNKVVALPEYGDRLLYSYETPEPMYGDVGEGKIAEDGLCYVWLDPVFAGTIRNERFQVFLQAYGPGSCYVKERAADHFVVKGEPGVAFGWEIKGLQADVEGSGRLERFGARGEPELTDYGALAVECMDAIYEGRII